MTICFFQNRKSHGKPFFLFLSCLFLLMSSCRGKEDNTITIAEQYGLAYAPLQIMREKAYLEILMPEARVNWVRLGNTAAIREAVLAGEVDAGFLGIPPFLIARDKGMEWKLALGLSRSPLGLVAPGNSLTKENLDEFSGSLALPQPGSIQHILLSMALERSYGDGALLDDKLIALKHPDGMNALLSGAVQGHFTSPPYLFQELEQPGFSLLLSGEEAMGGPFTFIAGAVTEDFHEANPDLYDAFIRAVGQSVDFIMKHPDEAAAILAPLYSLDEDLLTDYLTREGMVYETEIRGLNEFINFMSGQGLIGKDTLPGEVQFW